MINSSRSRGLSLCTKNNFLLPTSYFVLKMKNYLCIINTRFYAVLDRNQEY